MSDAKKTMMQMWAWPGDKDECKKQWKSFKSSVSTFIDQMDEMEKMNEDLWKEHWDKVFPLFLEMQDTFFDALPEEFPVAPGMPACPVKPKEFKEKVKEFQETANKHAKEQADSASDFRKQAKEKTKEMVSDAVKNIEEKLDEKK